MICKSDIANLKTDIGDNNFINILINAKIPNNEKFLFNEFFNYIKYPSVENFELKFMHFILQNNNYIFIRNKIWSVLVIYFFNAHILQ